MGRETWYLSWALDLNPEERAKGKTVEVGYVHCSCCPSQTDLEVAHANPWRFLGEAGLKPRSGVTLY